MFKKWLMKFSFFRNREISKIKKELEQIREDFDKGNFSDIFMVALHKILKSPVLSFNEELVEGVFSHITTYSNSSAKGVGVFERLSYKKTDLEKSKLININPIKRYYQDWYSNEDSVWSFVAEAQTFLDFYLYRNTDPNYGSAPLKIPSPHWVVDDGERLVITEEIEDFLDGLTFRLLLLDVIAVIEIYLGNGHDR